jgi:hypothetical protein
MKRTISKTLFDLGLTLDRFWSDSLSGVEILDLGIFGIFD